MEQKRERYNRKVWNIVSGGEYSLYQGDITVRRTLANMDKLTTGHAERSRGVWNYLEELVQMMRDFIRALSEDEQTTKQT